MFLVGNGVEMTEGMANKGQTQIIFVDKIITTSKWIDFMGWDKTVCLEREWFMINSLFFSSCSQTNSDIITERGITERKAGLKGVVKRQKS